MHYFFKWQGAKISEGTKEKKKEKFCWRKFIDTKIPDIKKRKFTRDTCVD